MNEPKSTKNTIKFHSIATEEKEAIILFDYEEEKISIYTTNPSASRKLLKKLGEPIQIDYIENEVASMKWEVKFCDRKKIIKGLSISNFITSYLSKKGEENQDD